MGHQSLLEKVVFTFISRLLLWSPLHSLRLCTPRSFAFLRSLPSFAPPSSSLLGRQIGIHRTPEITTQMLPEILKKLRRFSFKIPNDIDFEEAVGMTRPSTRTATNIIIIVIVIIVVVIIVVIIIIVIIFVVVIIVLIIIIVITIVLIITTTNGNTQHLPAKSVHAILSFSLTLRCLATEGVQDSDCISVMDVYDWPERTLLTLNPPGSKGHRPEKRRDSNPRPSGRSSSPLCGL